MAPATPAPDDHDLHARLKLSSEGRSGPAAGRLALPLEGEAERAQQRVAAARADQLEADRQAVGRRCGRQRQRGQAGAVDEGGEHRVAARVDAAGRQMVVGVTLFGGPGHGGAGGA